MGALVGVAIVLLGGIAVAWSIRRSRERAAAQRQLLVQSGFRPCDGDKAHLEEIVRSLRGSSEFDVHAPWKRGSGSEAIYWYEARTEAHESRERLVADEFLCPMARRSPQPFLLYLQPARLGKGFGAHLIEKVVTITAPQGLHKLDLSASKHAESFLAAFGPDGASLHDLLDDDQLAVLARGASHGVFAIRGNGGHCSMELFGAYARKAMQSVSWQETWSFVQQVAG